jgi:hypothetical protein
MTGLIIIVAMICWCGLGYMLGKAIFHEDEDEE